MPLTVKEKLRSLCKGPVIPLSITAFAALVIFTYPGFPYIVDDALSEKAVLSHAHEQGWKFGDEIVFTYGPLGFLASRYYFPHAATLRTFVDIVLSVCLSAGVVSLAWRMTKPWRTLSVLTFLFLTANIDPRYDLLLYCGLFSWAILSVIDSGGRLLLNVSVLSLLVAFSGLVKANFLITGGFIIAAVLADVVLRRQKWPSIILCALAVGFFFTLWWASGQSLKNLAPFFANVLTIAKGYNSAVGLNGLEVLRSRGFIAFVLALCSVILAAAAWLRSPANAESKSPDCRTFARRGILGLWVSGLIFLVWKHGFVRGDMFHMGFFFGFCPFCVSSLAAIAAGASRLARTARFCGLLPWAVVLFTMQRWCFAPLPGSCCQPFRQASYSAWVLFHPKEFSKSMSSQMTASFARLDLPLIRSTVGTASADVFGQNQIYALCNRLNYGPRPVFQSYMAYNQDLNRLNERFYLSARGPQYVLFQLTPIDHKFSTLEDSFVLRDLLLNYRPVLEEKPVLLLKRESIAAPQLTLLREGTVHPGEKIDLKAYGATNLWAEIKVKPTMMGSIRSAAYKPTAVRLGVRTSDGARNYKAPAPMLAAGFIASPLLFSQSDIVGFYAARGLTCGDSNQIQQLTRPESISVQLDKGTENLWENRISWKIYCF